MCARQAAVTLENARLYAEATQKTEEVAALNEIAAIVSRSLDLPAVLDAVLTQLGRVVEYDSASVFLDNGRSLAVVAARGYPRPEDVPSSPIPRGDNLHQRLLSIREPLIMSGVELSAHPALAPQASNVSIAHRLPEQHPSGQVAAVHVEQAPSAEHTPGEQSSQAPPPDPSTLEHGVYSNPL